MARTYHGLEKALRLYKANSDTNFIDLIFDAGAPIGTSGETDLATIGSIYMDNTNGLIYTKIASTSSASDWQTYLVTAEQTFSQANAVGVTPVELDSVLVDDVLACEWELHVRHDSTPANVRAVKIWATHDGTVSADAVNVDDTAYGKLKLGGNFTYSYSVELNGTGASQTMRIMVAGSAVGAVSFTARRNVVQAP